MSKIKYLVICLIVLMFPISAKALTGGVTLSCPSQAHPGDTINCTIKGTSSSVITGVEAKVTVNGSASITSVTKTNNGWKDVDLVNGTKIIGYPENTDSSGLSGNFDIATLALKINDDATAGIVTITISDVMLGDDFNDITEGITGDSSSINIVQNTEPENDKGLKSLRPTIGEFGVQFESTRDSYVLEIPGNATSFGFNAEAYDSNDQVVFLASEARTPVTDPQNIAFATDVGKIQMMVYIEVGSGDRKVTYTIGVVKKVSTGDTNELSSLKVGDQTVPLISGVYEYNVTLDDVTSYEVIAVLKDREDFEIRNLDKLSPRSDEGVFSIIIDPKDSSSGLEGNQYTINVIKSGNTPEPSSTTPKPSSSKEVNPPTGGMASVIMAIVLIASFAVSIYYYKRNISYLSK